MYRASSDIATDSHGHAGRHTSGHCVSHQPSPIHRVVCHAPLGPLERAFHCLSFNLVPSLGTLAQYHTSVARAVEPSCYPKAQDGR